MFPLKRTLPIKNVQEKSYSQIIDYRFTDYCAQVFRAQLQMHYNSRWH